jgi:hypothetical protein
MTATGLVQLGWRGFVGCACIAAGLAGCASLQSASSGQVGCAEQDIKISDDKTGWDTRTWTAECHGKKFYCSALGNNQSTQVSCKEAADGSRPAAEAAVSPAASPAATPATVTPGCQYDTQCKGDRVCVKRECVDPAPQAAPAPAQTAPAAP